MARLYVFGSILLLFWLAAVACPAPPEIKDCNETSDCPLGLQCLGKQCKVLPDAGNPPEQTTVEEATAADKSNTPEEQPPEPTQEPLPETPVDTAPPDIDPNAPCTPGSKRLCYDGSAETKGIGACIQGRQTCLETNKWAPCIGQTLPKAELCNNEDDDCDGTIDEEAKCDSCSACLNGKCVVRSDVSPTITKLSPEAITPISTITVDITGDCFAEKAEVLFQDKVQPTTYVSRTRLEVTLTLTGVLPGKYPIVVSNPGDKRSNKVDFELQRPPCTGISPRISQLDPAYGETTKAIPFSIKGSSFQSNDKIHFHGKAIPTLFNNASQISADPTLDLTNVAVGTYKVLVSGGNGCDSTAFDFHVLEVGITPKITAIAPTTVTLEQSNRLVITGQNFIQGATFYIGLNAISGLRYISPAQLEVTFTPKAADGWTVGSQQAYVINGNQKQSNTIALTIQ